MARSEGRHDESVLPACTLTSNALTRNGTKTSTWRVACLGLPAARVDEPDA